MRGFVEILATYLSVVPLRAAKGVELQGHRGGPGILWKDFV